jgi:O-antigen ligase
MTIPALSGRCSAPGPQPSCIPFGIQWTFYLLVFSTPFDIPRRPIPIDVPTITATLFLLAALLRFRTCFERIPAPLPYFGIYLYAVLGSSIFHRMSHPGEAIWLFLQILQPMLLFWAGYNLLRHREILRMATLSLIAACVLRALLQLGGIAMGNSWGPHPDVSFSQDPNYATGTLDMGLIAVFGIAYGRRIKSRTSTALMWAAVAVVGAAIIQMGSRGGLLALAGGLLAFVFNPGHRRAWLRNVLPISVLLALLVGFVLQQDKARARFEETVRYGSLSGRERLVPAAWRMFLEHPWIGWGLVTSQYELATRDHNPDPRHVHAHTDPHNVALEVLTSAGIFGFLPFSIGYCICVRAAWKARHGPDGVVPIALVTTVLIMNMSIGWIAAKLVWVLLAYALASRQYAGYVTAALPSVRYPSHRRRLAISHLS